MNETVTGASTTWGQRQDYVEFHGGRSVGEHFLLLNLLILAAALPWFGGLDHSTNCYFAAYDRDWCASMLGKRTVPEECVGSLDISINLFLVDISPAVCTYNHINLRFMRKSNCLCRMARNSVTFVSLLIAIYVVSLRTILC